MPRWAHQPVTLRRCPPIRRVELLDSLFNEITKQFRYFLGQIEDKKKDIYPVTKNNWGQQEVT